MSTNAQSAPAAKPEDNKTNLPAPVDQSQAVATVPRELFNVDLFANSPAVTRSFGLKPITNKEGATVGGRMSLAKRSELAKQWQLEGKENADKLDEKIRESEIEAFRRLKAWLVTQPDDLLGLRVLQTRTVKGSGNKRHSITLDELPAKELTAMQKLADALGITVEEVQKRMAGVKPAAAPIDLKK